MAKSKCPHTILQGSTYRFLFLSTSPVGLVNHKYTFRYICWLCVYISSCQLTTKLTSIFKLIYAVVISFAIACLASVFIFRTSTGKAPEEGLLAALLAVMQTRFCRLLLRHSSNVFQKLEVSVPFYSPCSRTCS